MPGRKEAEVLREVLAHLEAGSRSPSGRASFRPSSTR